MLKRILCIVSMVVLLGNANAFASADTGTTTGVQKSVAVQEKAKVTVETKDGAVRPAADGQRTQVRSSIDKKTSGEEAGVSKKNISVTENMDKTGALDTKEQKASTAVSSKPAIQKKILINLASRSLALYEGKRKVNLYAIGAGKTTTPTQVGYYSILEKTENPSWVDPSDPQNSIPSGEQNPLGYRWMQYSGNYGIHGTNHPESIGGYVSNGCIRMKESDVEDLFSKVEVGTPVEITYNRVVVEKIPDHTITYYIYPDGYGWQPLTVDQVRQWLDGYGVGDFESDEDISDKINASDGQPTYVAKVYALSVNGMELKAKAILKNDVWYIPAVPLAEALHISLGWDREEGILTSPYGKATGCVERDTLYCNSDDVNVLYHLIGGLDTKGIYTLKSAV